MKLKPVFVRLCIVVSSPCSVPMMITSHRHGEATNVCASDAHARTQTGGSECLPHSFHHARLFREDPANSQAGSTR
jgi:hypothetical protein